MKSLNINVENENLGNLHVYSSGEATFLVELGRRCQCKRFLS